MHRFDDQNDNTDELVKLREKLRQVDARFLRLVADRVEIARSIGALKRTLKMPVRAPEIESATLEHAAEFARELGIDESLFVELQQLLINFAVKEQSKISRSV